MKFKIRLSLLPKIVIAICLGIACGYFFPQWAARIFVTFNAFFSEFLGLCIPLIIIGFVAPAIAEIGGRAGKMLLFTAILAYVATLFAGFLSYFVSDWCFPSLITTSNYIEDVHSSAELKPYFTVSMPAPVSVMTALVLAFLIGLGGAKMQTVTLNKVMNDFREIISMVIAKVIIPLLPLYIFGIFLNMTLTGQVGSILSTFAKIIIVIFILHIAILIIQYCIAAMFSRKERNPFKMLWTMMPAYFTALGTSSSAATIPVTLRQAIKMGVSEQVAGFTIPLCATIHMSGSTLKIVACALALMILNGMPYDFGMFAGFICMMGITIIAAPGVPGGVIMASLGLLSQMLGFTDADNALMIALYITMDSFGTACNVTGDGALSVIVDRFFGRRNSI